MRETEHLPHKLEIDRCRKEGAQFFIVTHSPFLLGLPDAEILTFDDGEIHQCCYEDTDSYQEIQ